MEETPEALEKLKNEIKSEFFSRYLPKGVDSDIVIEAFEKEAKNYISKMKPVHRRKK